MGSSSNGISGILKRKQIARGRKRDDVSFNGLSHNKRYPEFFNENALIFKYGITLFFQKFYI